MAVKPFMGKATIPFLTPKEKLGREEKLGPGERLGREEKLSHEGFFCACPSSCAFNDSSPQQKPHLLSERTLRSPSR